MKPTKIWNINKKHWDWFKKWAKENKLTIVEDEPKEVNNRYLVTTQKA